VTSRPVGSANGSKASNMGVMVATRGRGTGVPHDARTFGD
jgi:hypothetical protein